MRYSIISALFCVACWSIVATAQVTVLDEPFSNSNQFTATPALESAGEASDYYRLSDGTDIVPNFSGFSGTFFAAQDTNGVSGAETNTVALEWNNLTISGLSNLQLSILIAEDDSSDGNEDWDNNSSVVFEYQIDNNGFQDLLAFESSGGEFNSEPAQDTNFDGTGNGTALTETPAAFMATIGATGMSLDLRLTVSFLDDGDEDVAIDNVVIMGDGELMAVDPIINEFVADHVGSNDNNEYIEIFGTPANDYSAYSLLQIEGDNSQGRGNIDSVIAVGTTAANGLYVTPFMSGVLENTSMTLLLVEGFTGMIGDDLDTNDDGLLDSTPWDRIVDDIAVSDQDAGDVSYAAVTLLPDFDSGAATVGGASRIPNGTDTDTVGDWLRNDFDGAGIPALDPGTPVVGEAINTPAAVNDEVDPGNVPLTCDNAASETLIHAVQGSGFASPLIGNVVEIQGLVVGDFQNGLSGELDGFFVQEEDAEADADPMTSEGVFVFAPGNLLDINVGDQIRVRGTVEEFFDSTQVGNLTGIEICTAAGRGVLTATPVSVNLPVTNLLDLERVEGMAVVLPQALTVSDQFDLVQFGEFALSNGRIIQPTNFVLPGAPANSQQVLNDLNRLLVDNGANGANVMPFVVGRDDTNPLNAGNPVRNGYQVTGLQGVMSFTFSNYKVQPTQSLVFNENANPRLNAPAIAAGAMKVASFNVLNFFTNLDGGGAICGPSMNQSCRGADSASELTRQTDKLVQAILGTGAQLVGLVELENDATGSLQGLVDALNAIAGAGVWDFINTGTIETDAIKVGFIYTPAALTPVGAFAILDSSVDPRFDSNRNRPAPAQTFMDNNGEMFTAIVNHLKSKGCGGSSGLNLDQGDGQACFNESRRLAALALADWVNTDPTGSGDSDFLILGDLNSYAMEDPIRALTDSGLINLGSEFEGAGAYSFMFRGQAGALDYAIATPSLADQVMDATHWHINADELVAFDYNQENLPGGGAVMKPANFYQPDAFRASDHDAVVVSMNLGSGIVDASNPMTMLSVNRTFVLADGSDATQVTIQLVNGAGTPLSGITVDLSVTGNAAFGQATGTTDVNGQFSTSLTSTTVELVTVSGRFDMNGDAAPETAVVNGFPRMVSFEDDGDFIFGDGYE